jgi:hypothetical protein
VVDDVREHQGRGLHVTCVTGGNRMNWGKINFTLYAVIIKNVINDY